MALWARQQEDGFGRWRPGLVSVAGSFYQSSVFGTETIENKVRQRGLQAGVPAEPSSSVPHVSNEQSEHTKTQSGFKRNNDHDETDVPTIANTCTRSIPFFPHLPGEGC